LAIFVGWLNKPSFKSFRYCIGSVINAELIEDITNFPSDSGHAYKELVADTLSGQTSGNQP
jgi:hypothetical protein